eukprot:7595295-Pyramimonas_sp.AAC.1
MSVDGSSIVLWGCLSSKRGALGSVTMRCSLPGGSFHACFAQSRYRFRALPAALAMALWAHPMVVAMTRCKSATSQYSR